MSSSVMFKPATARNKNKFSPLLCNEYHECVAQFEALKYAICEANLMDCIKQLSGHEEKNNPIITIEGDDSRNNVGRIVEYYKNRNVHATCIDANMSLEQSMEKVFSTLLHQQVVR